MPKELYFDISSEESGGSLYRITSAGGPASFYYNHSTYDSDKDEMKVFETNYPDFAAFWKELTKDKQWWWLHPLYIHPDQRDYVREQLKQANWASNPNKKWQESHQNQWKKVLTGPGGYYNGPAKTTLNF